MYICRRDLLDTIQQVLPRQYIVAFDYFQLYEIYLGMLDGLDISKYANYNYSSTQMQQIRLGLLSGINVDAYAKPEIFDYEMFRKRIELEGDLGRDE